MLLLVSRLSVSAALLASFVEWTFGGGTPGKMTYIITLHLNLLVAKLNSNQRRSAVTRLLFHARRLAQPGFLHGFQ